MKKLYDLLCVLILSSVVVLTVVFPKSMSELTKSALNISVRTVIPSLFPFMLITQLLSRTGVAMYAGSCFSFIISPLFGIPKALCGAFITGIIGGFPNGAHAAGIVNSQGLCTKEQAERCIAVSNNCSLPFIITVVGLHTLGSIKNGMIIASSQFISIFVVSLLLRICHKTNAENIPDSVQHSIFGNFKMSHIINKSITESVINSLNICGFITAFCIISGMLSERVSAGVTASSLIKGIFEISTGVVAAEQTVFPLNFIICSVLVGFSGFSVIFQVTEAADKYGLSSKEFVLGRVVNAVIMPVVTSILLSVLPIKYVSAFSSYTYQMPSEYPELGTAVVLYALMFAVVMILFAVIYAIALLIDKKSDTTKRKMN